MNEINIYYVYNEITSSIWWACFEFKDGHEEYINTRCYSSENAMNFAKAIIDLWKKEGLVK